MCYFGPINSGCWVTKMNYDTIAVILTVIIGWWAIHRDIAQLRERMAKLEGTMEVLKDLFQASVTGKT